jgi:hypothetical protein
VKGQTEIEVDKTLPPLPEPPAFWPMTTSVYSAYRVKGRAHCGVCVELIHSGQWNGTPRPAAKIRRKIKGAPVKDALVLCYGHAQQYVTRDNEARVKAGLETLSGGA